MLDRVVELSPRFDDWEAELRFVHRRLYSGLASGDCVNQMVKNCTEVAYAVRGDETPPEQRGLLIDVHDYAVAGGVGINAFGEAIGISFRPGSNFVLESLRVFSLRANLARTLAKSNRMAAMVSPVFGGPIPRIVRSPLGYRPTR